MNDMRANLLWASLFLSAIVAPLRAESPAAPIEYKLDTEIA